MSTTTKSVRRFRNSKTNTASRKRGSVNTTSVAAAPKEKKTPVSSWEKPGLIIAALLGINGRMYGRKPTTGTLALMAILQKEGILNSVETQIANGGYPLTDSAKAKAAELALSEDVSADSEYKVSPMSKILKVADEIVVTTKAVAEYKATKAASTPVEG